MKIIGIILVMLPVIYLYNYIKYSWNDNKSAAIGGIIAALLSTVIPIIVILTR